jgi:hypothetical protein
MNMNILQNLHRPKLNLPLYKWRKENDVLNAGTLLAVLQIEIHSPCNLFKPLVLKQYYGSENMSCIRVKVTFCPSKGKWSVDR